MASAAALRRQIRQQQDELDRINRELQDLRSELGRNGTATIQQLEQELQRTIEENRIRMNAEFQQRASLLRQQMLAEIQRQAEELRRVEKDARRKREETLRQLDALNQQLKQELEDIKSHTANLAAYSKEQALSRKREAEQQQEIVRKLPHAFFRPGQMEIYEEHLGQTDVMLNASMYDAAAATADAVLSELRIFEITLQEDKRNWLEMYQIYRRLIQALYDQIIAFEAQKVETRSGVFPPMPLQHMEYWSGNTYSAIRKQVMDAYEMIREIEGSDNVSEYLNTRGSIRISQFQSRIVAAHRLAEQLSAVLTCIQNERFYSDERYEMAGDAMSYLEEQGYQIMDEACGFCKVPDGEPIDSYEVSATINGIDFLHLSFVPVRENGVTVRNICLVTVEMHSTFDSCLITGIAQKTINALKNCQRPIHAQWNSQGVEQLPQQESTIKQQPDMKRLARKLERKY